MSEPISDPPVPGTRVSVAGRRIGHHGPAVVALGGGHGLSSSLKALRRLTDDVTAIVGVADDGGSSGRIRSELGLPPPGDLRMALAALCGDDAWGRTWSQRSGRRLGISSPAWIGWQRYSAHMAGCFLSRRFR